LHGKGHTSLAGVRVVHAGAGNPVRSLVEQPAGHDHTELFGPLMQELFVRILRRGVTRSRIRSLGKTLIRPDMIRSSVSWVR